jgi:long-chain acyl-CoA synthetase
MKSRYPGGPLLAAPELKSLPQALTACADRNPERILFLEPDLSGNYVSVTYRSFRVRVDSLARGMLDLRHRPVVGVIGSNSMSWCSVYMAALRSGGIVVPIDRELPVQEMLTILHFSGANMVFFDERFSDDFRERLSGRDHLTLVAMGCSRCPGFPVIEDLVRSGASSATVLPESWDVHAAASICYTSGTTGQAKGVVLTQHNLISDITQVSQFVYLNPDDIFLSILPVHHTFECTCGFLFPMVSGASIYISRGIRFVAEDLVNSRSTVLLAVPLLWEAMYRKIMTGIQGVKGGTLRYRFGLTLSALGEALGRKGIRRKLFSRVHDRLGGTMRLCISGGAGISPDVVEGFEKLGFTFLQGYGLTETSPIISVNRIGANRAGSVGPPLPDIEVRIDEPDPDGNGEIIVRGPNVMRGYHNDPEETVKVLSHDGWFSTGDYGHLDRDGYLFITGRKKNVIVAKNGKNVYPEEIELKIGLDPMVQECMVAGKVNEAKGEEIWLIVVPNMEKFIELAESGGGRLTTEFLVAYMKKVVRDFNDSQPIYKHIARFIIREEEFPKTTTKKVRRKEVLREAGLEEETSFSV